MNEMMTFHIGSQIEKKQTGTFIVPVDCDQISFTYNLEKKYRFLIFLWIKDPLDRIRFMKQLANSEPVIQLGSSVYTTTIGGIPGKCLAGKWTVEVFVFKEYVASLAGKQVIPFKLHVSNEIFEIEEFIGGPIWVDESFHYTEYDKQRVYREQSGWYRGDLHTHTKLSDGKELPWEANEKSKMMHLDYYVPTEHNLLHTGWPETDIMICPGIEITTTLGHANLFGVDRIPYALKDIMQHEEEKEFQQDMDVIIKECKEKNWLFSINHPYLYIWKWLYKELELTHVDCLEIINDPTYAADPKAGAYEANQKAVFLSDLLIEDGYRICAVGGSDSHNKLDDWYKGASGPSIPGDPATCLYMDKLSPNDLIRALRERKCYITRFCNIESNLVFGQSFELNKKELEYCIRIESMKEPVLFYLHNGIKYVCEHVEVIENKYQIKGRIQFVPDCYNWIRFGAETQEGEFLFYGNAMTQGTKQHEYKTFGEISEKLEKRWKSREFYLIKTAP